MTDVKERVRPMRSRYARPGTNARVTLIPGDDDNACGVEIRRGHEVRAVSLVRHITGEVWEHNVGPVDADLRLVVEGSLWVPRTGSLLLHIASTLICRGYTTELRMQLFPGPPPPVAPWRS